VCVRACVLFGQVVLSSSIFAPKEREKKAEAFAELEENYCYLENAVTNGKLDELKYLVEEAKVSLRGDCIASAWLLAYARLP
jgi:hypothetical protein